jgi:V8-like Glu-specific endopeptidase
LLFILIALMPAIPAAAAAAGPVSLDVNQPGGAVSDYWTKARMRAAEPVPAKTAGVSGGSPAPVSEPGSPTYVPPASPGPATGAELLSGSASGLITGVRALSEVLNPSQTGVRAHGKVFFTIPKGSDAGNFVCSGTAINSRNRSVVLTAGHCVFDSQTGGGKATNWMFVPAYQAGVEPFGEWTAKRLATTKQWRTLSDLRFDLGAAVVRRNAAGRQLQSVVGGRGIGFSQPRDRTFNIFGYPAKAPFTGELEYLCVSSSQGSDPSPPGSGPNTLSADCDMTAGASGGGWVVGKTVVSVVSYGYRNEPGILYGPYFSSTAKKLYKSVRGSGTKAG